MGPILQLEAVSKAFGGVTVVDRLDLAVEAGEFVTLLGPSGCGKSTTLNLVAGLLRPDSGTVSLRGQPVNDREPRERRLGMVFQTWALFPHLTAYENVAFGLRVRAKSKEETHRKVTEMLELVRLPGAGDKYPSQLSGGMQQRIALARSLALNPDILLLDEPLSNLDAGLRKEMQVELKRLHARLKITMLFVTHSQEEALVMSDRLAVMNRGRIVRIDAPAALYRDPRSRFVCAFLGEANVFEGTVKAVEGGRALVASGSLLLAALERIPLRVGQSVAVAVRPEALRISSGRSPAAENSFPAAITEIIYKGSSVSYYLEVDGRQISVLDHPNNGSHLVKGGRVFAECPADAFSILDEE